MKKQSGKGIYFRPESREILRVGNDDPAPDESWRKFSEDESLGLLAARHRLQALGLVTDTTTVEWLGMRGGSGHADERVSALLCRFKESSEKTRRDAQGKTPPAGRLLNRLRAILTGSGGDAGEGSSASLSAVPIRSREIGASGRRR